MKISEIVPLGALLVSIISIIVSATVVLTHESADLKNLKAQIGDPGIPSGIYAQIANANASAIRPETVSKHSSKASEEARKEGDKAEKNASQLSNEFKIVKEEVTACYEYSKDAKNLAEKALSHTKSKLPIGTIVAWSPKYRTKDG